MNTIWHIVKKDLRRFRAPIALMALILIVKAALLGWVLTHELWLPVALNSPDALERISRIFSNIELARMAGDFLLISDFWILIFLVMGILLEDPPSGERSFWRTRPISSWQMLAAKALSLFLVSWPLQAILQITINLLVKAQYPHEDTYSWYTDLGWLTLIQAGLISIFVWIALLWRNPIAGAGSMVIIFITYFLFLGWAESLFRPLRYSDYSDKHIVFNEGVMLAIYFGTLAMVAWWMYCRRKQLGGFLIFGAGLAALALVMIFL